MHVYTKTSVHTYVPKSICPFSSWLLVIGWLWTLLSALLTGGKCSWGTVCSAVGVKLNKSVERDG